MTATDASAPRPAGGADPSLDELRRAARRPSGLAWLALFLAGFAVLVLVLQRLGTESNQLSSGRFVLEDFEGRARASLDLHGGQQEVRFQLYDQSGASRFYASVGQNGMPQLQLRDAQGRPRVGVGVLGEGEPRFALLGPDGQPRLTLVVDDTTGRVLLRRDGAPELVLEAPASGAEQPASADEEPASAEEGTER